MLDTIESYSDRLDSLIASLLDMSRISSGSAAPLTAPVTWRDAIEEALRGIPGRYPRRPCPQYARCRRRPWHAGAGDRELVENALKYAPGSDVVIVGPSSAAGVAMVNGRPCGELRIVDHGQGVPADNVIAMFQPFQRLDDAPEGSALVWAWPSRKASLRRWAGG